MLIPLTCDAPIYHLPFATVGVIVANVLVFFIVHGLAGDDPETMISFYRWWVLEHGNGIHPIQWLTSVFSHAGLMHLIGNMLFLWIFGLVVEGKVGWWRFLLIYLGIGVTQSAIEQVAMLGADYGISLGASSAIYGIMAIAFVWAPKNDINCFYWFAIWAMGTIDIPIMIFALIYLAFDILGMGIRFATSGSLMSTGLLHTMGAIIGAFVGLGLLKAKLVDCEGWDLLQVWNGADPNAEPDYQKIDANVKKKKQAKEEEHAKNAKQQFDHYMSEDNVQGATTLYRKMEQMGRGFELGRQDLLALIKGLHQKKEWALSAPFMHKLIEQSPESADPVRIKLAQICVTELEKPSRALDLLGKVDFAKQPSDKVTLAKKIARRAKQLQAEGVYELDDEAW